MQRDKFDLWYAVNNTEIRMLPRQNLETFGSTVLNYHHVSEIMDSVGQVRVREGRMQFSPPRIVTPEVYARVALEGFGDEAARYVEWLREHEKDIHILQYGYSLRQESFSEQVITDRLSAVIERVEKEAKERNDPLNAVLIGVDDPWDVCLVKLFWEIVSRSASSNFRQMSKRGLFDRVGGVMRSVRDELEADFLAASRDASLVPDLGRKLQQHKVFDEYQDRFFALVKASRRK